MNEILTFIQIAGFVAGAVWIVATIKAKVDKLVESISELTETIDGVRNEMHRQGNQIAENTSRIARIEHRIASKAE